MVSLSDSLRSKYPHLQFATQWHLSTKTAEILGQCQAYVKAINNTPISPDYYAELMKLALVKGAQATTAIEGNSLSDEDIARIQQGEKLPPSKEYQENEVKNILNAFNAILLETVYENKEQLICKELLLRFHKMIGENLGEAFAAIPGRFRENNVSVGGYKCPDASDVPELVDLYCQWLRQEFRFEQGNQPFSDLVIQAIVAHVYLEWIHPFGDGNGRTGRLVEFYILSRGGNPDISLHVMSNHYNNTRPQYYFELGKASKTRDLTSFIDYAVLGYRDGLENVLSKIQESQINNTWQKYVYDTFNDIVMKQREVFKRRRNLGLSIPIDKKFTFNDIPNLSINLARMYSNVSRKTLERDLQELIEHKIIVREGDKYFANITVLNRMIAKKKGLEIRHNNP